MSRARSSVGLFYLGMRPGLTMHVRPGRFLHPHARSTRLLRGFVRDNLGLFEFCTDRASTNVVRGELGAFLPSATWLVMVRPLPSPAPRAARDAEGRCRRREAGEAGWLCRAGMLCRLVVVVAVMDCRSGRAVLALPRPRALGPAGQLRRPAALGRHCMVAHSGLAR